MKKKLRSPAHSSGDEKAQANAASPRKQVHSVLIQRAVLFTACIFLIGVLVGSPAFHLAY